MSSSADVECISITADSNSERTRVDSPSISSVPGQTLKEIEKVKSHRRRLEAVSKAEKAYDQKKVEYCYRTSDAVKFVFNPQQYGLSCQHEASMTHRNLLSAINTDEIMLMDPYFMTEAIAKFEEIDLRNDVDNRYRRVWEGYQSSLRCDNVEIAESKGKTKTKKKISKPSKATESEKIQFSLNPALENIQEMTNDFSFDFKCNAEGFDDLKEKTSADELYKAAKQKLLLENGQFEQYTLTDTKEVQGQGTRQERLRSTRYEEKQDDVGEAVPVASVTCCKK